MDYFLFFVVGDVVAVVVVAAAVVHQLQHVIRWLMSKFCKGREKTAFPDFIMGLQQQQQQTFLLLCFRSKPKQNFCGIYFVAEKE